MLCPGLVLALGLLGGCAERPHPERVDLPAEPTLYYPGPGDDWEHRAPEALGFDRIRLGEAVAYAQGHKTTVPTDLEAYLGRSDAPDDALVGPTKPRGDMCGLIIKDGYVAAAWGDTKRADMTFSVTKSFLSTLAGLALDQGLIGAVDDPAGQYVGEGLFDGPRHAQITWRHLLQQTSEWEGTLWDKPDTADRRRGKDRPLHDPGTFWEYNDVRVNLASLALLHVWKKPLPEVLKTAIMDPIDASDTWHWHGYRNSDVPIDGQTIKSVSGGGHWGGGMWINAWDLARFGYLFLRQGRWLDRQLFPASWIDQITTPTSVQPTYGYMWWLNTEGALWPDVPAESYAALGGGSNVVWIYPPENLVVVVRWIDRGAINGFLQRVAVAVENAG